MARIAGIDLPRNKRIEVALTYIYGIGRSTSQNILTKAGVDFNARTDALTEAEVAKIREIIDRDFKVEGDLRREVTMSIKRLMDLGCYRGLRHRRGLPASGTADQNQRSHPQGPAQNRSRQEEIIGGTMAKAGEKSQQKKSRTKEYCQWGCPYPGDASIIPSSLSPMWRAM